MGKDSDISRGIWIQMCAREIQDIIFMTTRDAYSAAADLYDESRLNGSDFRNKPKEFAQKEAPKW